jgi:hypothetical protein
MILSKKGYGVLCFVLIFSSWALTAPEGFGGPAPQDKEYPAVTFYVA